METALTMYSNAQYMLGGTAPEGQHNDGCPRCTDIPDTRDTGGDKQPRFHRCLRGWTLFTSGRTRKAFHLNVWLSIAAKLGLAGRQRMGFPLELLPLRPRRLVPPTSSAICATR